MKVSMFHLMPYSAMPEEPPHGPDWKTAGIWVDLPNSVYDPQIGNELYNEYLDELEYAEQVGLDGVCVNEHHANMYGTMPSPSIMLAALARRTSTANLIVLGTSIALYNPPTRVAEEMSMIDVISGGRVVCGFPVGTSQDTNWVYGMSPSTFRERYYEAEDLIKKAMETREPFHYNGKYSKLRYVSIWPRPAQEPRPPIWVPGGGSIETWDWTIEKDHVYAALSYGGYKRRPADPQRLLEPRPRARRRRDPVPRRIHAADPRLRLLRAGQGGVPGGRRVLLPEAARAPPAVTSPRRPATAPRPRSAPASSAASRSRRSPPRRPAARRPRPAARPGTSWSRKATSSPVAPTRSPRSCATSRRACASATCCRCCRSGTCAARPR